MSRTPVDANNEAKSAEPPGGKTRFTLLNVLLVTALVAALTALWQTGPQIERATQRIDAMQRLARELVVHDPNKIVVIKRPSVSLYEDRYGLHVPGEHISPSGYQLCIALEGGAGQIVDNTEQSTPKDWLNPQPAAAVEVPPGEHEVAVRIYSSSGRSSKVVVLLDDRVVFSEQPSESWEASFSSGASFFGAAEQSQEFAANQPVVLHQMRLAVSEETSSGTQYTMPDGECDGLFVWLRPTSD